MNTVIRGVRPENRIVEIRKMSDGSLRAVNASGRTFVIAAENQDAQAFIVYTMLHAGEVSA